MYCSEYGVIAVLTEFISAEIVTKHRQVEKGCGTGAISFILHKHRYIGRGDPQAHQSSFVFSHSRTISQGNYASEMSK